MPENHTEVAIVGAGPAGAHLARRLAAAGVGVRLFDPKAPWEKPCGGGITHKAWSMFPVLKDKALPHNEVFNSLQISPDRRFFVIREGHALVTTSRRELGKLMLDAATEAGAQHVAAKVTGLAREGRRCTLDTSAGPFTADFVVGADGVHSVVRESVFGRLPGERTLGAVCQFFEGGPADPTLIRITKNPGYAWAFARHDCLAVGAGSMQRGYDVGGALRDFMADFFPDRQPLGKPQGALLPYMHNFKAFREPRIGHNWALIGDAGGFVDTLTGEGIIYAAWSADLLADAFLAGRPAAYDHAWRKAFGWHLMSGAWVARYIFKPRFIDNFFTAITVCPALRDLFIDFVWNLPPYHVLLGRAAVALPRILTQWQRFMRAGVALDRELLEPFTELERHVNLEPIRK
jgi:flavin-dependent dehydrogenase